MCTKFLCAQFADHMLYHRLSCNKFMGCGIKLTKIVQFWTLESFHSFTFHSPILFPPRRTLQHFAEWLMCLPQRWEKQLVIHCTTILFSAGTHAFFTSINTAFSPRHTNAGNSASTFLCLCALKFVPMWWLYLRWTVFALCTLATQRRCAETF
jgi:hypothetical protein